MAKQSGIYKLSGSLDDTLFVQSAYGFHVRKKPTINKNRIYKPAYERQLCAITEYAKATKAGKLLRGGVKAILHQVKTRESSNNLNKAFYQVILSDQVSERGARNVLKGDISLIKGFDFNESAPFQEIFSIGYTLSKDVTQGTFSTHIPAFKASEVLRSPKECTHYELFSIAVSLDFLQENVQSSIAQSGLVEFSKKLSQPLELTNQLSPNAPTPIVQILGICFYQQVNGITHHIKNHQCNAMKIVEIWK